MLSFIKKFNGIFFKKVFLTLVTAVIIFINFPIFSISVSAKMRYFTNVESSMFPADLQNNLSEQPWKKGFIDVTKSPYNAKGDGITDDTAAIQQAIDDGYLNNLVVFFPSDKTYLISNQLTCKMEKDSNIHKPGYMSQRKFGHLLIGSTKGTNRPKLKLKDGSKVKDNILVKMYWFDSVNSVEDGSRHYLGTFRGMDIDMGNNPECSALYNNGAQFCTIEDVTITGTAFNIGIDTIPGSGGYVQNVKIIGGKVGILVTGYRPNPTIMGAWLENQSNYGIKITSSRGPLSLVGFKIISPIAPDANYYAVYASSKSPGTADVNLVDGTIEVSGNGGKAIYNFDQNVAVKNVYVKADTIIESGIKVAPTETVSGNKSNWKKVSSYFFADGSSSSLMNIDGVEYANKDSDVEKYDPVIDETPVDDFISKHTYGVIPSWEDSNTVDITTDYAATADSMADDDAIEIQKAIDDVTNPKHKNYGKTVFIPRGHFHIRSSIMIKKGVKLIGGGKNISVIHVADDWAPTSATVAVDTVDDPDANIVISDVGFLIRNPSRSKSWDALQNITLLRIRGGNTVMRDFVLVVREINEPGEENPKDAISREPLIVFSNNAGGKVYGLCLDDGTAIDPAGHAYPSFRQLLIKETVNPLTLYHISIEHARVTTQSEINNSKNVTIYGLKFEIGGGELLRIADSDNIKIIGGSGNYGITRDDADAIFKIINSNEILITNVDRSTVNNELAGKYWVEHDGKTLTDDVFLAVYETKHKDNALGQVAEITEEIDINRDDNDSIYTKVVTSKIFYILLITIPIALIIFIKLKKRSV